MNSSIKNSLAHYKSTGYGEINNFLREVYVYDEDVIDSKDRILKDIGNIDTAIKFSGKENSGKKVYRGIKPFVIENLDFIERGFSSTTTNIEIAAKNYTDGQCCILYFEIPNTVNSYKYPEKGYKEEEILIQRNLQYLNISEVGNYQGVTIFTCTIKPYQLPTKSEVKKFEKSLDELRKEMMKKMMEELDFED
jgi:hypothetical protein